MELALELTIIALLVFVFKRESQAQVERKDLLDRLMAKDFVEYKEQTQEPIRYEPVNVTDEAEYWREIEERRT